MSGFSNSSILQIPTPNVIEDQTIAVLESSRIIICSLAHYPSFPITGISCIIYDDNQEVSEPLSLIPLISNPLCTKLCFLGDSMKYSTLWHPKSIMERLLETPSVSRYQLQSQYRLMGSLIEITSPVFYNNKLISASNYA